MQRNQVLQSLFWVSYLREHSKVHQNLRYEMLEVALKKQLECRMQYVFKNAFYRQIDYEPISCLNCTRVCNYTYIINMQHISCIRSVSLHMGFSYMSPICLFEALLSLKIWYSSYSIGIHDFKLPRTILYSSAQFVGDSQEVRAFLSACASSSAFCKNEDEFKNLILIRKLNSCRTNYQTRLT